MTLSNTKTAQIVGRYRKIAWITVGAVLFLILVGALVRMTGSGMGCPDWPQCFGQWVPPTDLSQLPADYKTRFAVAGKVIADFDPLKTWIEYVNRLIGVLIGGLGILTVLFARPLRKAMPAVWRWSLGGLILIILQGFLGAYVVRTHLETATISLHMFMALLVLGAFVGGALWSYPDRWQQEAKRYGELVNTKSLWLGVACLLILLVQMLLGTQVRETVDELAIQLGEAERANWLSQAGRLYDVHKVFYYVLVLGLGICAVQMKSIWQASPLLSRLGLLALLFTGFEVLMGLGMHHLGLPKAMQPAHLLLASLLFADLLAMLMIMWLIEKNKRD